MNDMRPGCRTKQARVNPDASHLVSPRLGEGDTASDGVRGWFVPAQCFDISCPLPAQSVCVPADCILPSSRCFRDRISSRPSSAPSTSRRCTFARPPISRLTGGARSTCEAVGRAVYCLQRGSRPAGGSEVGLHTFGSLPLFPAAIIHILTRTHSCARSPIPDLRLMTPP